MAAAPGRELRIAVVGATGAVGEQIVELIDARALPCAELALFATERGATQTIEALGEALIVAEFHEPADLSRFDIAFLAVAPSWAADIVRARPGPLLVDLSAALRAPSDVPATLVRRARIHTAATDRRVRREQQGHRDPSSRRPRARHDHQRGRRAKWSRVRDRDAWREQRGTAWRRRGHP